ncbi:hypothetical protein GCM10027427_20250 [Pseudoclavibacter terrae]
MGQGKGTGRPMLTHRSTGRTRSRDSTALPPVPPARSKAAQGSRAKQASRAKRAR